MYLYNFVKYANRYICTNTLYYVSGGEEMERKYLQTQIKELVDECRDLELLYIVSSLLGGV